MITSTRNERVLNAVKLQRRRHRRDTGHALVEGPAAVGEALEADVVVVDAFYLEHDALGDALSDVGNPVTPEVLKRLATTEHPRGPIVVIEIPNRPLTGRNTMVLAGVGDPGNAGTIIRSAAAFGLDVMATPGTVDVWGPKVIRAGAGGHFRTAVVNGDEGWLTALRASGLTITALVVAGGVALPRAAGEPRALLVGAEAAGLADEMVEVSDELVTLPMPGGSESLNASVAASIAMYEVTRSS